MTSFTLLKEKLRDNRVRDRNSVTTETQTRLLFPFDPAN